MQNLWLLTSYGVLKCIETELGCILLYIIIIRSHFTSDKSRAHAVWHSYQTYQKTTKITAVPKDYQEDGISRKNKIKNVLVPENASGSIDRLNLTDRPSDRCSFYPKKDVKSEDNLQFFFHFSFRS